MSATQLRAAASLLRERAEAATPGPWSAADEHGLLGPDASPAWCVSQMRPGYESMSPTEGYVGDIAETSLGFPDQRDEANAAHIAALHPAVALAVADWLDSQVLRWEQVYADTQQASAGVDQPPARHYGDPAAAAATADYHARHALAVAIAYLGTP